MKRRALAELVSQYADDLGTGVDDPASYWEAFPQYRGDLEPLFVLSSRIKGTLRPVEPSPEFTQGLRSRLFAAWCENKAREDARRREWWIRAAAVGSLLSMATLAAVVARSRGQWIPVPEIRLR